MRFTLRARWILPVDRQPLHGGYLGVDGASIVAVGNADPQLGPVTDLGDVVLMPGLVNAHTHLEFSRLEAPLANPGVGLPSWIRQVIADRGRRDRDAAAALAAGLKESLAAGVTTLGEIATAPFVDYPPAHEPQPFAVHLLEAIGFSTGRIDSVFTDLRRRLDAAQSRRVGLSPHAPYTVHPQLLERIVGLAAERAVPVAMHLAESAEELELLATGEGEFRTLLECQVLTSL
jgi:cytosine/adenosine deaminase-related metal-dependent hydrolase